MSELGPVGRLGRLAARHPGRVGLVWLVIAVGLGVLAPKVEHALSGAGWEASGSESVEARERIDGEFGGLSSYALQVVVHSDNETAGDPGFEAVVARAERILRADNAVARVIPPQPGASISTDRHTAVIQGAAAENPNDMVRAADELKGQLAAAGTDTVDVKLSGAAGMWSDFNEATARRSEDRVVAHELGQRFRLEEEPQETGFQVPAQAAGLLERRRLLGSGSRELAELATEVAVAKEAEELVVRAERPGSGIRGVVLEEGLSESVRGWHV